MTGQNKRTG